MSAGYKYKEGPVRYRSWSDYAQKSIVVLLLFISSVLLFLVVVVVVCVCGHNTKKTVVGPPAETCGISSAMCVGKITSAILLDSASLSGLEEA